MMMCSHTGDVGAEFVTVGVGGSGMRVGGGVRVPVDQGDRGDCIVGSMSRRLTPLMPPGELVGEIGIERHPKAA